MIPMRILEWNISGIYLINEKMVDNLKNSNYQFHVLNFVAIISYWLATQLNILVYVNIPMVAEIIEIVKIIEFN